MLLQIFIFTLFANSFASTEDDVVKLTKYLEEKMAETDKYVRPLNNYQYKPYISAKPESKTFSIHKYNSVNIF